MSEAAERLRTMTSNENSRPQIVLDYSVLDHLYRLQVGTYKGPYAHALTRLRTAAEDRRIEVWLCEITPVEMLQGLERLAGSGTAQTVASNRDAEKIAISKAMHA